MKETFSPDPRTGLSARQVAQKRLQGLVNTPPEPVTQSVGQILKANICTLFNLFNLLIGIALALVGAWTNLLFLCVIALNTLIGIVQELHARKLLNELSLLSIPRARVIRDGAVSDIPVDEVVEEDVLELSAGAQVCADAVILEGAVEVNESLLTGESEPVARGAGEKLFSGSFIVSGRCRAAAVRVGAARYAAQLTAEARKLRRVHSQLLASMRKVTRFTAWLIPPLGILLFLEAVFLRSEGTYTAVVHTAAGLLGMLPKGLVLLISISLAAGILALSKKKVLVQELYALESLAHVDTLCLDKTGTLTLGKMAVESVSLTSRGRAYPFEDMMAAFLACSDDNNATFQALQARFASRPAPASLEKIPFSAQRKWSAVRFPDFTFLVGAPERLAQEPLPAAIQDWFRAGKRVLAAGITHGAVSPDGPLPPVEMLAFIALTDPIRPSAAETLAYFQREGVSVKLISGDNPAAAAAVARRAGLPGAERCIDMSGVLEETDIAQAARAYTVFGRVSPRQKQQLIQALRRDGRRVAMVGDGVNDLPALREADCSIAVASGSDAARQAAQVVLLESDFSVLPDVLAQGRRVVNNITRVAGVFFVKTLYSLLLSAVCLLLNLPFPLVPIQVTLIDLAIEGYPAFFMTFEPDGRKVTGDFLPTVLRRALPNALSILACFLLLLPLQQLLRLPPEQAGAVFYLLVGAVGIQAVLKASWPLNRLRAFLCVTMTVGFFAAVVLFHGLLQVALPGVLALALSACLILLSFFLERTAAAFLRQRPARAGSRAHPRESCTQRSGR